jgi:MFS family permease
MIEGRNPLVVERRALLATGASNVLAVLPVFLLGALAVFIRAELGFTERALGLAVSIYYGSSAVLSILGGRISERLGPGRALRLAALGSTASGVAIALVVDSWGELVMALLLAGFANAVAQPAGNLALAQVVRADRQGTAFGLKQSAGPGGVLVAGVTVPVVGLTVGWRYAYGLTVLLALVTWLLAPRGGGSTRASRSHRDTDDLDASTKAMLSAGIVFAVAGASALSAFYVESAVSFGHPPGKAGWLLATGSLGSIAVRITLGRWADRRQTGRMKMVIRMMAVGAIGFALLAHAGSTWILVPATMLAFAAGWGWPGLYQFAIVRLNPGSPGDATGVIMVGMFAGGMIGPIVFGTLVEAFDYTAAWWVLSGAIVASAGFTHLATKAVRSDISRRTNS